MSNSHQIAWIAYFALVIPFVAAAAPEAEPGEDDHDVPPEIVDLVRKKEFPAISPQTPELDRKAQHTQVAKRRSQHYSKLRERLAKFDERWKEFAERKQVVDKAVSDAGALAAGKLDEARKILEAVITPIARQDSGKLPKEKGRTFVEVRDAELPALAALARVARDQHDWNTMFGAEAGMYARHRIDGVQAAERLLALAWEDQTAFIGYNASDTSAWSNAQVKAANDAADGGVKIARTFDTGLRPTMINSAAKLKKGDWVMMPYLTPVKTTGKHLTYSEIIHWRVPTECHKTGRISFIDDSGTFHYEEDCTYDEHSEKVTLDAALREPVPAWAIDYWRGMTVVGKLEAAGPHWKLSDAVIVDTRFTE